MLRSAERSTCCALTRATATRGKPDMGFVGVLGATVFFVVGLAIASLAVASSNSKSAASSSTSSPVLAWGSNGNGQLGNGTDSYTPTPAQIQLPDGASAVSVAAGGRHAYVLDPDGVLYGWGYGGDGELGSAPNAGAECPGPYGPCSNTPIPISLPGGVTPTAISAGMMTGYAIGSDGNLYAWGNNDFGQLGNGTTAAGSSPVPVSLPCL